MASSGRSESKNQVKRILEVLSRHSDVVSDALDGVTALAENGNIAGVDALVEINVLMAIEEGQYNLNPRIRSFLSEHLAQYSAFQTLTRISEQIHGAKAKWSEIVAMKASGDMRDMPALEESLSYTIAEIVHFTSANLALLHTQIDTEYGNVTSFKRKLAQNRFYSEGVKALLAELGQLEAFTEEIDREAIGKGLYAVRHIVHTRISAYLSVWISRLNDVQARISNRLFAIRQLERNLLYLSKIVLWLAKNPTRNGLDMEPDEAAVPATLIRPVPIKVRPQLTVFGVAQSNQEMLEKAVSRLPPARSPWERKTIEVAPQYAHAIVMQVEEQPVTPEDQLIEVLVEHLDSKLATEVSIVDWMRPQREALGLPDDAWLLYVANQLNLLGIRLEFVMGIRAPSDLNDNFVDVVAFSDAIDA